MKKFLDAFRTNTDARAEKLMRTAAQRYSRRSFIGKAALFMAGSALMPVLPFDQGGRAFAGEGGGAFTPQDEDESSCDYWRYCALDGSHCSDCGGTLTTCPPGSEASKVSWVGTCRNPSDGQDYVVSYNDCCGRAQCNAPRCYNNVDGRPGYQMSLNNDIDWCMANDSKGYHCTVTTLIGKAEDSAAAG